MVLPLNIANLFPQIISHAHVKSYWAAVRAPHSAQNVLSPLCFFVVQHKAQMSEELDVLLCLWAWLREQSSGSTAAEEEGGSSHPEPQRDTTHSFRAQGNWLGKRGGWAMSRRNSAKTGEIFLDLLDAQLTEHRPKMGSCVFVVLFP